MRWDAYDWTVRMKICWLEFSCENPWWTLKAKFSEVKSKEAKLSIIRISDFCKLLCVKLKWKQGNLWVTELRILQYYLGLQGTLLLVLSGCVTKLISCWYNALDWNNRSDICCWGGFGWGTNVEYMWRMLNLFPKWKMNVWWVWVWLHNYNIVKLIWIFVCEVWVFFSCLLNHLFSSSLIAISFLFNTRIHVSIIILFLAGRSATACFFSLLIMILLARIR